jgi:hypothetical protein
LGGGGERIPYTWGAGAGSLHGEWKWFLSPPCEGGQSRVPISTFFSFSFSIGTGEGRMCKKTGVRTLAPRSDIRALAVPMFFTSKHAHMLQ